jgi:hypothetical protein
VAAEALSAVKKPLLAKGEPLFNCRIFLLIVIGFIVASASADATPRHKHRVNLATIVCDDRGCSDQRSGTRAQISPVADARAQISPVADANGNDATVVGGRPTGCPRAFCGCEASRYVFGEMRPELYLASNWMRKFPRASPASGMVAVRSHHVMVLISHAGGNDWLVHDGNSGGGLTRRHVQSIRGHVIVDPRGSRSAQR